MKNPRATLSLIFISLGGIAMLIPIVLLVLTAFKPEMEIIHFSSIFPETWTLENFETILLNSEEIPLIRWFFNSVFISSMITLLVLTVDSLAAFALTRLALPGRNIIFAMIIGTLMIPATINLVPVYLILNNLGWLDTPLALIIPAGAGAFGVFLLRQFFIGIPKEMDESAMIDGCSRLRIYWHIILPLARPALATLGIFTFVGAWNDFLGPLIFFDSLHNYTLPVGIALFQSSYRTDYGLTIAASLICTLPVLIVFAMFQRHIIEGISLTGLKD